MYVYGWLKRHAPHDFTSSCLWEGDIQKGKGLFIEIPTLNEVSTIMLQRVVNRPCHMQQKFVFAGGLALCIFYIFLVFKKSIFFLTRVVFHKLSLKVNDYVHVYAL